MENKNYAADRERENDRMHDEIIKLKNENEKLKNEKEKIEEELEFVKRMRVYSDKEWDKYKRMYAGIEEILKKVCEIVREDANESLLLRIVEETLDDNGKIMNIIKEE